MTGQRRDRRRVAVVGAGISGLAAAHRLIELGDVDVSVLEARSSAGGVIWTTQTDGFVIEGGPDSILTEKPWGMRLVERLGLAERVVGTNEQRRKTYVVRGGRLHALPEGFMLLAPARFWPLAVSPLFSLGGKMRMTLDLVLPARRDDRDESLASFTRRRLGHEALDWVAQPLVGGIYTADPESLSLKATMPRFLEMERRWGSVIRAMRKQQKAVRRDGSGARWSLFASFDGGLQVLVDALVARLPDGALRLGTPVEPLRRVERGWQIGDRGCFDAVVLAVPAHRAAILLGEIDRELAGDLGDIRYASSAVVSMAFRREDVGHPLDGFGFVVPIVEGRRILAGTLSSLKYPGRAPEGTVLARTFIGGALQPELFEREDGELVSIARAELGELLGVRAEPLFSRVDRHPQAMAQYDVGHLARVDAIERRLESLPTLALAGNAYRGIGIPDCIHSGEEAAERIHRALVKGETADARR